MDDCRQFGLLSPDLMGGQYESMPKLRLARAFTPENRNVLLRYGLVEKMPGRMGEFLESEYSAGSVAVVNGSPTVTGTDTIWTGGANHKPEWVGRKIYITDSLSVEREYIIDSVDSAGQITLTENYDGSTEGGLSYKTGTLKDANNNRVKVPTPDGETILHYERLLKTESGVEIEYFFAFTKSHGYLWDYSWSAWVTKFTCTGECDGWSTTIFNQQIIASNNLDKVQVWGTTISDGFANMGGANGIDLGGGSYLTRAGFVAVFENYLCLFDVTIDGTAYPSTMQWSDYGEITFDLTGGGDTGSMVIPGEGSLVGAGEYDNFLIVGKNTSTHRIWLVTGEDVFNRDKVNDIGWLGKDARVNDKEGRFYWLADDFTIREINTPYAVSAAKDKTFRDINPQLAGNVKAAYIEEYGQIWWAVPYSAQSTGNNKIIWQDTIKGRWGEIDHEVAAFGRYSRQASYTIDTIPFATIEQIGWETIDSVENVAGFAIDIASDHAGGSYSLHAAVTDDGNEFAGIFTIATDMTGKKSISQYKRIHYIQPIFAGIDSGDMDIYYRADNDKQWQGLATVSLISDKEYNIIDVPVDVRGRNFEFKFESSERFKFLGIIFYWIADGIR